VEQIFMMTEQIIPIVGGLAQPVYKVKNVLKYVMNYIIQQIAQIITMTD